MNTNTSTRAANIRTAARRALAVLTLASIGAGAVLASTAAPAHAAFTGCDTDCINPVSLRQLVSDKTGVFADFTTTVPTAIVMKISTTNGQVVSTTPSVAGYFLTKHTIASPRVLNQGQGYVVSITATEKNGKKRTEQMSLTALQRTVKVVFGKLSVSNDSDTGAGEIKAGAKVGSNTITLFGQRSITAPYSTTLGTTLTATKVPSSAKLMVELMDDDVDFGEFCPSGTGFDFTSGSTRCYDWTTGSASLGSLPEEKGSSVSRSTTVAASGKIAFAVAVTITVSIS